MEHFFAYTSRMRFISRWALMRNSQPENIRSTAIRWQCWPMRWR